MIYPLEAFADHLKPSWLVSVHTYLQQGYYTIVPGALTCLSDVAITLSYLREGRSVSPQSSTLQILVPNYYCVKD